MGERFRGVEQSKTDLFLSEVFFFCNSVSPTYRRTSVRTSFCKSYFKNYTEPCMPKANTRSLL